MVEGMGIASMLHFALAASIFVADVPTGVWTYATERDPLGQAVHVAEIKPDESRPFVAMRLMCGGIVGVSLQVNLGEMQSAAVTSAPAGLSFEVGFGPMYANAAAYSATAAKAPITDGLGTYELKGSEAGNVAHLLMQGNSLSGDTVLVKTGAAHYIFPLSGAPTAIGEVIANCPFKV